MMPTITIDDLRPGDVLLHNSDNLVARLIRAFDESEVSHAGLYLGNGEVGESLIVGNPGVNINPLVESIIGCNWVSASRLHEEQPPDPLLAIAHQYLEQGNRYAYGQIFLLAAICLTRKLDQQNAIVRRIAERTMRGAAGMVEGWRQEGREPMICSEFVFRTYDEALPEPDDHFSLEILSQQSRERRRWFSRFRRRRGLASPEPDSPVVHPESLLVKLKDEPARFARSAMMAAAPQSEADVEADVESLAREYFGETLATSAPDEPTTAAADATPAVVEAAAEAFSHSILDAVPETNVYGDRYGADSTETGSTPERLTQIVADFVTPGDLHKSPSLRTIGTLST